MNQVRTRKGACALIVVGILAAILSIGVLYSMPDTLQYAIAACNGEEDISQVLDTQKEAEAILADYTSVVTVGAITEESSVGTDSISASATVYAIAEGWFEVYPTPLYEGRRLMETELHQGNCVALIDVDLAFKLFNSELPQDAKITVGENEYDIVGTIRHRRSVGETQEHCIYVPLTSSPKTPHDVLIIAAKPIDDVQANIIFENTMQTRYQGRGSFYSVSKEAQRQMMILRILLLLFGLSAFGSLARKIRNFSSRQIIRYRDKLRNHYFKDTLPSLVGIILICILGYVTILILFSNLVAYSLSPLIIFTEWIPENFVDWTSIKNVFWNLSNSAAKLVKVGTREIRRVQFWGNILRWSVIGILTGNVLRCRGK